MIFELLDSEIITLNINGEDRKVAVKPSDILLYTLRNSFGLTGPKPGCENGDCGACTVLVNDLPVKSCLMLTVPIQKAFVEEYGFQCGYCTSGFLMVCHSLSKFHPEADDSIIQEWLQSNICRCTGYEEISIAVKSILNKSKK